MGPPGNSEELRGRYELIANAWLYAQLRHPGRKLLADLTRDSYSDTVNYLLGPKVAELEI